jgi:prepilin-type N-terminal cleavage/methylation domain-containing protein
MKRAFTLVELLIVIGVIAILLAITLPALARASARARCSQCISNLKQAGNALRMYADDYDDQFPMAYEDYPVELNPFLPSLRTSLAAYVKADSIWICPSDIGETFPLYYGGYDKLTPAFFTFQPFMSYDWPGLGIGVGTTPYSGVSVNKVKRPSETPVTFESRPWHGVYSRTEYPFTSSARYNVLHVDASVSSEPWSTWHKAMQQAFK